MLDKQKTISLIYSYNYLENTCKTIDGFVNRYATNFGISYAHGDVEILSNKIIDLIERKKRLINLKVFLDILVSKCSERSRKILTLMMQYNFRIEKLVEVFNVCERSVYRYVREAFKEFERLKTNYKFLFDADELLKTESWILNLSHTYTASRKNT